MASATLIAPPERHAPSRRPGPRPTYSCPGCGHVLRMSGLGRKVAGDHRLDGGGFEPRCNESGRAGDEAVEHDGNALGAAAEDHTHEQREPLTPNQIYEFNIEIRPYGIRLRPGYRLAIRISGYDGDPPTHLWQVGDVAVESRFLPLSERDSGNYELRVGVFHRESGERLPITGSNFPTIQEHSAAVVPARTPR